MEKTQIQSELFKAVDGPNGWQSLRHLMLKLKKEDSDTVLDALLGIFFWSTPGATTYAYQKAAGGLLWKLKPKYRRNIKNDIQCSLKHWNVSIEELPWYLAEVIGIEKVRNVVKSILTDNIDEIAKKNAETYLYWLSAKDSKKFKARLNHIWNGRLRG